MTLAAAMAEPSVLPRKLCGVNGLGLMSPNFEQQPPNAHTAKTTQAAIAS